MNTNLKKKIHVLTLVCAVSGAFLLTGCASTSGSRPGTAPPEPTVPLYDRDDLIKEPEPPKIPTKADKPDGGSQLKKTGSDKPLYQRPK
jgi:hypothetical protein